MRYNVAASGTQRVQSRGRSRAQASEFLELISAPGAGWGGVFSSEEALHMRARMEEGNMQRHLAQYRLGNGVDGGVGDDVIDEGWGAEGAPGYGGFSRGGGRGRGRGRGSGRGGRRGGGRGVRGRGRGGGFKRPGEGWADGGGGKRACGGGGGGRSWY